MAFDPTIGLDPNNFEHSRLLASLKIDPIFHDLSKILKGIEPEGKLCLPSPRSLNAFVNAVEQSSNGIFLAQGGIKKHVLVSAEIDTFSP